MDYRQDLHLLEGFVRGEPERVEAFTRRFYPKVRSLVFKMIDNEDESKDITQEVFITVFEKHSSFRGEASLQTWILRIAYNLSLKSISRKGRFQYTMDDSFSNHEDVNEPWEILEERYAVLQDSIDQLNAGEQLYLELFYTNGCSIREMSRILGKTETAVKTGLSRVRAKLGEIMNKRYGEI